MTSCEKHKWLAKKTASLLILVVHPGRSLFGFQALHVLITAYTSSEDHRQLWRQNKMDLVFIVKTSVGLPLLRTKFFLPLSKQIQQTTTHFFLIFPRKKKASTFHANCLLKRKFAWNDKAYFLEQIRKLFEMLKTKNVVRWNCYPAC